MKSQPKWGAAFFAALLALCGICQAVQAQPAAPSAPPIIRTYYDVSDVLQRTIVLRLKLQDNGHEVYGAWAGRTEEASTVFIYEIQGRFDPGTGILTATLRAPPALRPGSLFLGTVQGKYDSASDSFQLTLNYQEAGEQKPPYETSVLGFSGSTPFLVGIWQWSAGTTDSAHAYSGEFYIIYQDEKDGIVTGLFSGTKPGDVGSIFGFVDNTGVTFTRTDDQTFAQRWSGQVAANVESIQGGIVTTKGSAWTGEFVAFSFPRQ